MTPVTGSPAGPRRDHRYESHCTLVAGRGTRALRGRVVQIDGQELMIRVDGCTVPVCIPPDSDIRCGDIVETCVDEGTPAQAARLRIVVRPAHPSPHDGLAGFSADMVREVLEARARMLETTRDFFLSRGFIEVPTPSLVPSPGLEPHLAGFETTYVDAACRQRPVWLPTSPEFALKRALCGGLTRVFEVRQVFRNHGELGPLHHPEFTMLEWYRAFEDYRSIMDDTEQLGAHLARHLCGDQAISTFRGVPVSWAAPYPRISVAEAFRCYAGIDLLAGQEDHEFFRHACSRIVSHMAPDDDFDTLFCRVMLDIIEPRLGWGTPVLLHDYPISMAALAVPTPDDPQLCERFELYVAGVEMANAFTEVNDPREMALRIRAARASQRRLGKDPTPADGALLRAMRQGMPPAGGIAMGMDRMLMAMLGRSHIAEVMPLSLHDEWSRSQRLGTPNGTEAEG